MTDQQALDIVVVKLTSAGTYQWHTFYGSSSGDRGNSIAMDGGGNVYITGYSRGTWQGDGGADPLHAHSGYYEIVALKLTSAGAYRWHTFYGSPDWDYGQKIAVDGTGSNIYIAGTSNRTWRGDGGAKPLHAYSGSVDIVALKLRSMPNAVTLSSFRAASGFDLAAWLADLLRRLGVAR